MSRETNSIVYRNLIFVLGFLASNLLFGSVAEKTRLITKEVAVNAEMLVDVLHERGPIDVEYYQGTNAVLTVNMIVRGDVEEDLDMLLSKYSLDVNTNGQTVNIESSTNIKSWNQTNAILYKRTRIRFEDGSVINSQIDDIKVNFNLKIPMVSKLDLTNKYHDINVTSVPFDLSVTQFSAGIEIGDVTGDFALHMKYGKGSVGQVGNANLELFDSKIKLKNTNNLQITDKYSDIVLGNANEAKLQLFDATLEMGDVGGQCDIQDKYSKITMGSIKSGVWDLFDAKIKMTSAEALDIKTKYTEFEMEELGSLKLVSFDDHFNISSLKEIVCEESKYTNYEVENLESEATFVQSFDDKFQVTQVGTSLSGFSLDGKYTKVTLPIPTNINYRLEADCKYGKVEYPQDEFDTSVYIEKNSELTIKAQMKGANDQSPLIKISGFDNKVILN